LLLSISDAIYIKKHNKNCRELDQNDRGARERASKVETSKRACVVVYRNAFLLKVKRGD
jgi:hypothetical protein